MASTKVYKVTGFDKVIFNGVELNQVPPTLEECRWDMIQTFVKDGSLGDHFDIGDTKTIRLSSGEEITMQLVSINDGTGDYGTYYPADTADFVSLNATLSSDNMCDWADSESDYAYFGWHMSKTRNRLNSNVFNKLPGELREIIVPKYHQYERLIMDSINKRYTYDYVYCEDNLWLPTLAEMRGGEFRAEKPAYNKDYTPLYNKVTFHNIRSTSSVEGRYTDRFSAQNLGFISGKLTTLANRTTYPVLIGFRIG